MNELLLLILSMVLFAEGYLLQRIVKQCTAVASSLESSIVVRDQSELLYNGLEIGELAPSDVFELTNVGEGVAVEHKKQDFVVILFHAKDLSQIESQNLWATVSTIWQKIDGAVYCVCSGTPTKHAEALLESFSAVLGDSFILRYDADETIRNSFRVTLSPISFFISPSGRVVRKGIFREGAQGKHGLSSLANG